MRTDRASPKWGRLDDDGERSLSCWGGQEEGELAERRQHLRVLMEEEEKAELTAAAAAMEPVTVVVVVVFSVKGQRERKRELKQKDNLWRERERG